jgi:hypothetical protein
MASGRPRQPNDRRVMASVEAAMSTVTRPRLIARVWHWRYELGLIAGVLLGTIGIGVTLGPGPGASSPPTGCGPAVPRPGSRPGTATSR